MAWESGGRAASGYSNDRQRPNSEPPLAGSCGMLPSLRGTLTQALGSSGADVSASLHCAVNPRDEAAEVQRPSSVASPIGNREYDMLSDHGSAPAMTCLGRDLNGPSLRWPRLVRGAENNSVDVLHRFSDTWYIVRVVDTGVVGLASGVRHAPTMRSHNLSDGSFEALFKKYQKYKQSTHGYNNWIQCADFIIAEDSSEEARVEQEHSLLGDLERISFHDDGTSSSPFTVYRSYAVHGNPLKRMCVVMFCFMAHHWETLTADDDDDDDDDGGGGDSGQDRPQIKAADVFLHGLLLVVYVSTQSSFRYLERSEEFVAVVTMLNRFAAFFLYPEFSSRLLENGEVLDKLKASLPKKPHCLGEMVGLLSKECSPGNMYLLFALLVLDGCLTAGGMSGRLETRLHWEQLAENLTWKGTSKPMAFLQAFARDCGLGFYSAFTNACPLLAVVKRLYPKSLSLTGTWMASYDGQPSRVVSSTQQSARVWDLPLVDLEAIWILANHAELNSADVAELLKYVGDRLCGNGDLQTRKSVLSLTASYHLDAARFEAILDYAEKERAWQILHFVYDVIVERDHALKAKAISTVRQVLLDVYFYRSGRDSDSDSDSHRLKCLASGVDSAEGEKRRREEWAHLHTTLALFEGSVSKLSFPPDAALETMLTVMCDTVVIHERERLDRPLLQRILHNIHELAGRDPVVTAEVVTKSAQLSGCRLRSLQSAMAIPLLGNGLACGAQGSCAALLAQAQRLLETLQRSGEFAVAPDSPVIILCWSYCKWLGRACRAFSPQDAVAQLARLSAYAGTLSRCTAVDGVLFSSLLSDLELTAPTAEVLLSAQTLAPLLAVVRRVWREHVATGALPESALAGYASLRHAMSALQLRLAEEDYPRDTWSQLKGRVGAVDALLRALELPEVGSLDGWPAALSLYRTQSLVLRWLAGKTVPGAEELLGTLRRQFGEPATTLRAFRATLGEVGATMLSKLTGAVGGTGTGTSVADYITGTISRSRICRHYAAQSRACRQHMTADTWVECVARTVGDTFRSVSHLLDGARPVGNVAKAAACIVREANAAAAADAAAAASSGGGSRALHLLRDEMRVLAESAAHQSRGREDFDRLRRLLHLEIVRQEKGLEHMLAALLYRVPRDDEALARLEAHRATSADDDDDREFLTLAQADDRSGHVHELIRHLSAWHWDFFRLIATRDCTELLAFFRQVFDNEADFEKRLAIANTRLQGDQRKSAWITTLLDVKAVMMAFCCPERSVAAIVERLRAVEAVDAAVLENAMHNLAAIEATLNSVMESSFDRAKRELAGLHRGAAVRARLFEDEAQTLQYKCSYAPPEEAEEGGSRPANAAVVPGETSRGTKLQELGKAQLEELQLCLPYFYHLPEVGAGECGDRRTHQPCTMGRRDYEELFSKLSSLQRLHQSASQLLDDGDVGFMLKLPAEGFPLSSETITRYQRLAVADAAEWKAKLARLRKSCLFFHFVSNACIGQLLVQIRQWRREPVVAAADDELHRLASAFLSHVLAVRSLVTVVDVLSLGALRQALREARQLGGSDDNVLEHVVRSLSLNQSLQGGAEKAQVLCTVASAPCSATQSLMALLCAKLGGVRLCRAQVLFCSGATAESELEHFFAVIAHSPGGRFALCGVDRLRPRCMSSVLRHQEDIAERKKLSVQVFYLFYDSACLKMWPVASSISVEELAVASAADLRSCFESVVRNPAVSTVAVSGDAGVGKSRFIDHVCTAREGRQPVIVNLSSWDDFDAATRELARLLGSAAAGDFAAFESVAFRVAPNADLDMLNRFFFEALWCQSSSCLSNRYLFSVPDTASEIRWNWYVELPDVLFQQQPEGAESIAALPFLSEAVYALETVTEESFPLQLDGAKRKLAAILLEESTEGLGRPKLKGSMRSLEAARRDLFLYERDDRPNVDEATAIAQLRCLVERTCDGGRSRVEQLFIMDYIHRKWSTVDACAMFRENAATYWNLAQEVFRQYRREAMFYCQDSIVCNFRQFEQQLLIFDGLGAFQVLASRPMPDLTALDSRFGEGRKLSWSRFQLDSLGRQRDLLGWSFNLSPGQVESLLAEEQFVLTEDFAFKLVAIHERKKLGKPLILEGETGSGKSFLLKTYTTLMNHEAVKDTGLMLLMNRWMYDLVKHELWSMMTDKARCWYAGDDSENFLDTPNREDYNIENLLARDDCTALDLSEIWKNLLFENQKLGAVAKGKLRNQIQAWIGTLTFLKPASTAVSEALGNDRLSDVESCQLIRDWLRTEQKSLFKKMLVHPGITKADVTGFVEDLANLVRGTKIRAVGFFDEVNTASCIDVFKELIVNSTIDGKAPELVEQMFFVAAINPLCEFTDRLNLGFFELPLSAPSEESERWQKELGLQYLVNPLPKSMLNYRWKYQSLEEREEVREYTHMKIGFLTRNVDLQLGGETVHFSDAILELLSSFLFHSYDYCRVRVSKRFVSQRDFQRVFKLIPFFWRVEEKWYLREESRRENSQPDVILKRCILQAIAMVFYLRLPVETSEVEYDEVCRSDFDARVTESVRNEMDGRFNGLRSLETVLTKAIDDFVTDEHFVIPKGIALTSALKENIYCMVACMQQRIPLGIIGEPGSSKTLGCQIVCRNMRGINSDREFCRVLTSVDSFFCQCSPDTTTDQIQSVFKGAIDRQAYHANVERKTDATHEPPVRSAATQLLFDAFHTDDDDDVDGQPEQTPVRQPSPEVAPSRHRAAAASRTNVAVLIDEAGLPSMKQNRMVMKVLHKYLDEPEVSFVALSNHWFDAANTNRMLTVFRSHATSADLVILAHGCISRPMAGGGAGGAGDDDDPVARFIRGVCAGYEQVRLRFRDWFHQRDLISLFRCLRRRQLRLGAADISVEARDLCEAVEENFNGHGGTAVGDVVDVFFSAVARHLPSFRAERPQGERNSVRIVMDLKSELEEHGDGDGDGGGGGGDIDNTNALAMRYLMLIDDYGCDYALLDALKHLRFLDNDAGRTRVFQLASLAADAADELQCTTALAKIRQALAQPCTVVLVNSPMLHGYLYELLNQSYQTISVRGEKCAYSNIAMKDSTFPCQVHRHFRCIVLLSRELACRERTPFLSRFAKFGVHPSDARQYVSERLQAASPASSPAFADLRSACLRLSRPGNVDEGMFLGCGRHDAFRGTVDCLSLGQLVGDTYRSFSLRGPRAGEMRRDMVASLLRLLPLERFLLYMPSLAADYARLYFADAPLQSTLGGLVRFAVAAARRTQSHVKYLAVCKSPTRVTHRFLAGSPRQLEERLGRQLAAEVTVASCRQLESVLRAEQALEEFMASGKLCLVLAVDAVKGVNATSALGALKQLVDGQLALWRASSRHRRPKVIVLLLHGLPRTADGLAWCSFLNGWRTRLVAVADPGSFAPLGAFAFLAAAGAVPSAMLGGGGDEERDAKSTALDWLRATTRRLSRELAPRFPWRSMAALSADEQLRQISPPGTFEVDHVQAQEFLDGLFEKAPCVLAWTAEEFAGWVERDCHALIAACCEQARPGGSPPNLLNMIQQWQDAKIRDLLLFACRAALTGGTWKAMIAADLQPSLVGKLMSFVANGEDLHSAWFQPAASYVSTPFFFHVRRHVQTLSRRLERRTVDGLADLLAEDRRVPQLCSEEVNFLDRYAGDVVRTTCCWTGAGRCVDLTCLYLKRGYQSLPQPKNRTKYLAFVTVTAANSRSLLLALLHGCDVLLRLEGNEFQANRTAREIEMLMNRTADDDLPEEFAILLVKKLWEKLRTWTMNAGSENAVGLLGLWRRCFDQLCLYWPFADGCSGERWPCEISAVLDNMTSSATWSKHLRLMTFSSIVLRSVSGQAATRQLAELVRNYVDVTNPTGIVSAGSLGAGTLIERLLGNGESGLTPGHQLDTHQMRVFCVRWMASKLDGNDGNDAAHFRVILQCISCVDQERGAEMEPRMPPALAAAAMRRAEAQQNDARLKRTAADAIALARRLDVIQVYLNDYLKKQTDVSWVSRRSDGDYIISRFYPSDFPERLNASHRVSASEGNRAGAAAQLNQKKEDAAFALSVNHGFYRLACHMLRAGGLGLSDLVPEAKVKSSTASRKTVGWVVRMRSTAQVAFETAALSLARHARRLQASAPPRQQEEGGGGDVRFAGEKSVAELLADHADGAEWPLFLCWWLLYLAPPDAAFRAVQGISSSWARACEDTCRSMELLNDSGGRVRLGCVDDFARYQKLNAVGESMEGLVKAVTKTGFRSGYGSTLTKITHWLAKTRSDDSQKSGVAEACVFLKLGLDYFHAMPQSDFSNLRGLSTAVGPSDLLKRALQLLFDLKDGADESEMAALMRSSAAEDVAVREILLETLAVVLMIPAENHLHACVVDASEMAGGTYVFGALSARHKPFGMLPGESLDDLFLLSSDRLPGCLSEMEVCSSSVLSLLGYVLAAMQTYAALCWNALLHPEQAVWTAVARPDDDDDDDDDADDDAEARARFVERCVRKIASLYRLLPCADPNAAPAGRKLLALTSLQCFGAAAAAGGEHRATFRRAYRTPDERAAAERVFRDEVCAPTLRAYSADVQQFLAARVSPDFAEMHRLLLATVPDSYGATAARMPADELAASGLPPALDCAGIVCCLAADKHRILAEVLANRRIYAMIGGVADLIKYYHRLRRQLSDKLTFRLVVEEKITLQGALALMPGARRQESKAHFADLLGGVKQMLATLRRHDVTWQPGWTEAAESSLSLQTELVQLVDFGGRSAGSPVLRHLIAHLLRMQDRLLEVCDCSESRLEGGGDRASSVQQQQQQLQQQLQQQRRQSRDAVHISDVAAGQHQGLLQLDEHTVDELMALYCPVTWSEYWSVAADLPGMERSLVAQVISPMKKVVWSVEELRFPFANVEESWEAHLEWAAGVAVPLSAEQERSIAKSLPGLASGSPWSFAQAVRQLALDRLRLPAASELSRESPLQPLAMLSAGKQLCQDLGRLPGNLTVGNLIPLLRCVERHLDNNGDLVANTPPVLRRSVTDDAGLAQAVEHCFPESVDGLQQAAQAANDLASMVRRVEARAMQPLVATVREAQPRSALRDFLAKLPPAVELLGVHYTCLLGGLVARVKTLEAKLSGQGMCGAVDSDPCGIVAHAEIPTATSTSSIVNVLVNVQQRKQEESVPVRLRKKRSDQILETLYEAIRAVRQASKEIHAYSQVGGDDEFFDDDDGDLGSFLSDSEDELEMLVVHKK